MRMRNATWIDSVDLTGRTTEEARRHLANLRRGIDASRDALSSSQAFADETWRLLAGKPPASYGRHGSDLRVIRRLRFRDRLRTLAATAPENGLRADLLRLAALSELEAMLIARSLDCLDESRRVLSHADDASARTDATAAAADAGARPPAPALDAPPAPEAGSAVPAAPPAGSAPSVGRTVATPTTLTRMPAKWEFAVQEVRRNHMRCQEIFGQMESLARTTEEVIVVSHASMQLAEDVLGLRVSQYRR